MSEMTLENCKILTDSLPNSQIYQTLMLMSWIMEYYIRVNHKSYSYNNLMELTDYFKTHSAAFPCF